MEEIVEDNSIGNKIRNLRMEKGLTLNDLSDQTGLSTGYLSQFERGITNIAVDSLRKITEVLGVSMGDFFQSNDETESVIVRKFDRTNINIIGSYNIERTIPMPKDTNGFYVREITILPKREGVEITEYRHEGEEFVYVLEGILCFSYEGEKHYLYPGDCAHYSSQKMHNWSNDTSKNVTILVVSSPVQCLTSPDHL